MITYCIEDKKEIIFRYISDNIPKCLYIYLDVKKYKLCDNLKVWLCSDEDNNINAIIMKYYTGMHIFSKAKNYNIKELLTIIENEKPSIVCAESSIINNLEEKCSSSYEAMYGTIKTIDKINCNKSNRVKEATTSDTLQMAKMLCSDYEIGGTYTVEEMQRQLVERLNDGYVRNYLIFDNEKLIAQAGTNAEIGGIAVIANVMVDNKYRSNGLATEVVSSLCVDLLKNNKVYLVCYNDKAHKLYNKIGFYDCVDWGRLTIKSNDIN